MSDHRPPLPEVRTILDRAWARRSSLLGLIETIPDDYWSRRAADDAWPALDHLRHLATIDGVVSAMLADAAPAIDGRLLAAREEAMASATELEVGELLTRLTSSRADLAATVAALDHSALGREILLPPRDAWSPPGAISFRAYLAQWAEHDALHEASIRRAIANQPGPADLARAAFARRMAESKAAVELVDKISGYASGGGRRFTRDEMNER